jgi:hypothetical protein
MKIAKIKAYSSRAQMLADLGRQSEPREPQRRSEKADSDSESDVECTLYNNYYYLKWREIVVKMEEENQ